MIPGEKADLAAEGNIKLYKRRSNAQKLSPLGS